jgi:lipopolysaccharide transport system permease protein
MMGIYVFLFVVVFKIRIGGTREMPLDYTAYLLAGLIPWLCFQEALGKASNAITSQANLVKQVIFPIEVLPVKGVLATLATMVISLAILAIYILLKYHRLPLTFLLVPLLVVLQTMTMVGLSFLISAVAVYFRDTKDLVQVFTQVTTYLIPIFYLPEQVPESLRPLLYMNPFSYMMWCYQDALYFGRIAHPESWVVFPILSLVTFYLGFRAFSSLKVMFGNVL